MSSRRAALRVVVEQLVNRPSGRTAARPVFGLAAKNYFINRCGLAASRRCVFLHVARWVGPRPRWSMPGGRAAAQAAGGRGSPALCPASRGGGQRRTLNAPRRCRSGCSQRCRPEPLGDVHPKVSQNSFMALTARPPPPASPTLQPRLPSRVERSTAGPGERASQLAGGVAVPVPPTPRARHNASWRRRQLDMGLQVERRIAGARLGDGAHADRLARPGAVAGPVELQRLLREAGPSGGMHGQAQGERLAADGVNIVARVARPAQPRPAMSALTASPASSGGRPESNRLRCARGERTPRLSGPWPGLRCACTLKPARPGRSRVLVVPWRPAYCSRIRLARHRGGAPTPTGPRDGRRPPPRAIRRWSTTPPMPYACGLLGVTAGVGPGAHPDRTGEHARPIAGSVIG